MSTNRNKKQDCYSKFSVAEIDGIKKLVVLRILWLLLLFYIHNLTNMFC
jgi:hypothetical protein